MLKPFLVPMHSQRDYTSILPSHGNVAEKHLPEFNEQRENATVPGLFKPSR